MESYAQVLNFAIPFFMVLIAIEWIVGYSRGVVTNRSMDTISSLSSGLTNSIKDVLGLSIVIISYSWMKEHLGIFEIESKVWMYVLCFIGLDFAGYWSHRFSHQINIFWNRHIIHHSSEEFNLACALRQSISNIFAVFTFLFLPMALIGIPTEVIGIVAPLHLFAQFWYHTRLIDRMGILEYIIVTPSHHRVHHAINPEYIDKNYSQVFIFWDKLFGTFQQEVPEIPPVYGVKRAVKTWNPILINFQHFWLLLTDAWRTQSWLDRLRIWFMPTGWRPEDVKENYPVEIIEHAEEQHKYDTPASTYLKTWSWMQLVIHVILMLYLFNNIAEVSLPEMMLYGLFLFTSIYSFTTLMDGSKYAVWTEIIKMACGLSIVYWQQGWYGIDAVVGFGSYIIVGYIILSMLMSLYFEFSELRFTREQMKIERS
jgi:sterol desaturase/sphingolipid hydroxylase (fatty acid hydroxylase superfamily)